MASRIARGPLVQVQRQLATQGAPAVLHKDDAVDAFQTTKLNNGLLVASMPASAPGLTSIGIFVRAGTRAESYDNLGVGHALRIAAGLATKNNTSFSIVRNLQQAGGSLSCCQGREFIAYTTQMRKDMTNKYLDFFLDVVCQPVFKPWELGDNKYRMELDLAQLSNSTKVLELLHQAAYRTGLGNSLFSPDYMIGKHKVKMLQDFREPLFKTTNAALIGTGVDHDILVKVGEDLSLGQEAVSSSGAASKFHKGEIHCNTGGPLSFVALGVEGAAAGNPKEVAAFRILQHILGTGPRVYGSQNAGLLQKAVNAKVPGGSAVSALCYSYSDSGLIGASIVCEAASAGKVVETVGASLRSISVTQAQVDAAKKSLTLALSEAAMSSEQLVIDVGSAALAAKGQDAALYPHHQVEQLSRIQLADVQAAAKKVAGGQMCLAAMGNLSTVPHVESL